MSHRLVVLVLFAITVTLNFRTVLLFSSSRQNSRFLRDFEPSSSESALSSSSSSSTDLDDSSEDAVIVTGSQPAKLNATHKAPHEDVGLRELFCPADNLLMRYDLRVGQCFEIDSRAHCGKNMIFKEETDSSSYGYCECDFENHEVPLVFHLPSNSCFPIYSQGYCQAGEWLVLSKDAKGPACQKNQCPAHSSSKRMSNRVGRGSRLIFPSFSSNSGHDPVIKIKDSRRKSNHPSIISGSPTVLVPLNGDGPCLPLGVGSKFCENDNERVIFSQGDIIARCGVPGRSFRRLSIVPNACPPGSYYSIIGYCQPVWDF